MGEPRTLNDRFASHHDLRAAYRIVIVESASGEEWNTQRAEVIRPDEVGPGDLAAISVGAVGLADDFVVPADRRAQRRALHYGSRLHSRDGPDLLQIFLISDAGNRARRLLALRQAGGWPADVWSGEASWSEGALGVEFGESD